MRSVLRHRSCNLDLAGHAVANWTGSAIGISEARLELQAGQRCMTRLPRPCAHVHVERQIPWPRGRQSSGRGKGAQESHSLLVIAEVEEILVWPLCSVHRFDASKPFSILDADLGVVLLHERHWQSDRNQTSGHDRSLIERGYTVGSCTQRDMSDVETLPVVIMR